MYSNTIHEINMTNSITINKPLMKGLINEFKVLYQDNIEAELYKWELLQDAYNKNNLEIVDSVIKKSKNLVYASNKTVLKDLLKISPKGLDGTLTLLYDLSTDLKTKLSTYEHNMSNLCPPEWKNKAKDENEASVLLSCKYPNTYTFYMYKVYIALCQYLNIEPIKNAGERYPHFMKIIEEINQLFGEELQETISSYTNNFKIRPTLLAVQTFIWIMFIEYPQTVKKSKTN